MSEVDSDEPQRGALGAAALAGAAYAAIGAAWVLLPDAVASAFATSPLQLARSHVGALTLVGATAVGLALCLRSSGARSRRATAAARASELQVQDLFLRHPKPMWVYDPRTLGFLKVNDAAIAKYGYTEAEFLAMTLRDIRPADDLPRFDALVRRPIDGYRDVGGARHRKKSGEMMHVHVTAHTIPFAGRPAVMVMAIDVSHEVLSRHALERQEARFRQLHQSLAEVLWLAAVDGGEILYVSPAFEQVYGRPAEAFRRDPQLWLSVVVEEDRDIARGSSEQLRLLGHSTCEYRIRRPDGTVRWIADRKKAIHDDEGLVRMIGGIAEDITANKELDAVRLTAKQELERTVAERTAELERVNVELEAFTRTAAHDLKSPLNGIVGASQLVRERHQDALGHEGIRMLDMIGRSARQMASLIDDLLMLSRVSQEQIHPQQVDLAVIARDIVDELRRQEPQRRVDYLAPPHVMVRCDAGLARSLLSNLLGNAWKFSARREVAQIRLESTPHDGEVVVSVVDNGVGFDAKAATRLFTPFQRFHSASQFTGTGIGLVTCQRIVQRHGGSIRLDSAPDLGTTVTFTLPGTHPSARESAPARRVISPTA